MTRRRLDAELVRRGLARSREQARDLIEQGSVRVGGVVAQKAATQVDDAAGITVQRESADPEFASRGGLKLAGALERLGGPAVAGRTCLDAGASTGGFTDVLLRAGATHVVAVDVGYGQLAWRLRTDPRVTVMERMNVRHLTPGDLPYRPEITVADLSFISLSKVLPGLLACADPHGDVVPMVKPQFEVGRLELGSGGVVRDWAQRAVTVRRIADEAFDLGWGTVGTAASPLPGPSGNVEFFLWLRRGAPAPDHRRIDEVVEAGA